MCAIRRAEPVASAAPHRRSVLPPGVRGRSTDTAGLRGSDQHRRRVVVLPARGLEDRIHPSFGEERGPNHGYKRAFGGPWPHPAPKRPPPRSSTPARRTRDAPPRATGPGQIERGRSGVERFRVGDDRHRPLAFHRLRPGPVLGRDSRRPPGGAGRSAALGLPAPQPEIPRANPPGAAEAIWAIPGAAFALLASYLYRARRDRAQGIVRD
jgi:hypothetical protein